MVLLEYNCIFKKIIYNFLILKNTKKILFKYFFNCTFEIDLPYGYQKISIRIF